MGPFSMVFQGGADRCCALSFVNYGMREVFSLYLYQPCVVCERFVDASNAEEGMGNNVAGKKKNTTGTQAARSADALRFYGDSFVLNTASGMFYRLSATADYLLRAREAGAKTDEFADLIMARYGVDHATAVRDSELLLNQLTALGLLENEPAK